MSTEELTIRAYRPADREAVREICQKTAFRNRGCDFLFEDGELFADYWTNYYLQYEPDLCFIAEKQGKVVGYLLGSADFGRFERVMKRRILPTLLVKMVCRLLMLRFRERKTYRYLRWAVLKSWREMPPIPYERFPAHYHSNVLREAAFLHGFSSLLSRYLDELERRGVPGLYGIVLEPEKGGWMSRLIERAREKEIGREDYSEQRPTALFRDVLRDDTPMVNRVYGCSIETYRNFVAYARKYFRL